MGMQLFKISNLKQLHLLTFSQHFRSCLGAYFWPPDMRFCMQVRLIYVLGYALKFSPDTNKLQDRAGGPYAPPHSNELPRHPVLRGLH